MLFVENINQQIWMFDHSGELIEVIGSSGRGPEEFMQISGVFIDGKNRLVVTDETQNLVKIFDINGDLISTFSLFDNEQLFIASRDIFVHDDTLYLQVIEAEFLAEKHKSHLIARYDLSGEFIDLIGRSDPSIEDSNHYLAGNHFAVDTDEDILISSLETTYRLQMFNTQDPDFYEYFGRMPSHWNLLEEEIDPFLPRQEIIEKTVGTSYSLGVFLTNHYILLHSQNTTDLWFQTSDYSEKLNFLTVYDRKSREYIGSIELSGMLGSVYNEQLYIIEDFDPDNFLISRHEMNTH